MFNIKKLEATDLLRLFLGLIFFSAGLYRAFNWQSAVLELSKLNLSSAYLIIFIIALEIIGGFMLIFNKKIKLVILIFIIFLIVAISQIILTSGQNLINNAGELFSFDANPTDVFLHFTYLIILIYLLNS